ncbi:MAG: TolC family protein [Candidatus Entotheonellia bacterium]
MAFVFLIPLLLMLVGALSSCATPDIAAVRPDPRPLGRDLQTFQAPQQPTAAVSPAWQLQEPTGVLTLRQALALALLQNPELAATSWEVRAGEARTLQAGLLPNPEIGVEVENFAGSGEFRGFDAAETTIALGQLVELGGKRLRRARVAALERDLAAWDYEAKRLDVFTETTKAFVEVLGAQARLTVNADLVRLAEQVLSTAAERVRAGKVPAVEETKAQVALSTARIALERAGRELTAARKRLAASWGSTIPSFERAEGALERTAAIPSAEQLAQRIGQNPDIARWVVEMAQRQAAVTLEESRRIPDVTAGGGVRRLSETRDTALVFELTIPLVLFDRNQGARLEARYQLAKAGEERRAAEVRVHTALATTYAALSAAFIEATQLRDEVLPGARSAFEAANEGYRQGKFGFLEVLDAQRTLFEARSQYIEALASYHQAVAEMERLIGEPLEAVKNLSE